MTDYPPSIKYYNEHCTEVSQQYLSVSFEDVHKPWSKFLPALLGKSNLSVLDVGAATGRDISYLYTKAITQFGDANKLGQFIAIEPSRNLLKVGEQFTKQQNIKWISDSLPALQKTHSLQIRFDLILLSAVWMHIPKGQRPHALRELANLLKPKSIIVMSLKQGMSKQEQQQRAMHNVSVDEVERLALDIGLVCQVLPQVSEDALNREDVYWETVVLELPDCSNGIFAE